MKKDDDSKIFHLIRELQLQIEQHATIAMSRVYQGVALYDQVSFMNIQKNTALLQSKNSLFLLDTRGPVFLHDDRLPHPIRARILHRDLADGTFMVGELAYMPKLWIERGHIRVTPSEPVYFILQKMGRLIRANLLDLDQSGLGATADRAAVGLLKIKTDCDVDISLPLSPNLVLNSLRGVICNARNVNKGTIQLGIQLRPTPAQALQLTDYIEKRHDAIMSGLRVAFMRAMSPVLIQDLYF